MKSMSSLLVFGGLFFCGATLSAQQPGGPMQAPQPAEQTSPASDAVAAPKAASSGKYLVPSGTRLPLVLHNAVSTRNAKPGDPVYLETLFPIVIDDRILIPAGS